MCEFCSSRTPERVVVNRSDVQCSDIPKSIVKITRHSLYKVVHNKVSKMEYIVQATKIEYFAYMCMHELTRIARVHFSVFFFF